MRYLFPEDLRFDCHGCGRCCRTAWPIRVDGQIAGRHDDGSCVYLTEGARCSIHERKPLACQVFPFTLESTPEGVVVGASFLCPSIQQGLGRPLNQHRLPDIPLKRLGGGPIPVRNHVTIGWIGYQQLEAHLLEKLATEPPERVLGRTLKGLCRTPHELDDPLGAALGRTLRAQALRQALKPTPCEGDHAVDPGHFLRHVIWRKFLIRRGHLADNLALLLLIAPLIEEVGVGALEANLLAHRTTPIGEITRWVEDLSHPS